jgi:hypothetical protein
VGADGSSGSWHFFNRLQPAFWYGVISLSDAVQLLFRVLQRVVLLDDDAMVSAVHNQCLLH